jgi:hypothetical protein
VHANV